MESHMPSLNQIPEIIKQIFDILDLVVVRSTILGLAVLGAYALFRSHKRPEPPPKEPETKPG
jgi:hypothetical protein